MKLPPWQMSFQWKVLHRLIPTGRYLFLRKLRTSDTCTFCELSTDNLLHFFFYCERARMLWNELAVWLNNDKLVISCSNCLLGILDAGIALNTIFTWTRSYIYKNRLSGNELSPFGLRTFICSQLSTFRTVAKHRNTLETFDATWRDIAPIFSSELSL